MFNEDLELGALEAAAYLHVSQGHATELMRSGALAARQLPSGTWLTSVAALDACVATTRRGHGRTLTPASAWGVLWELSGLRPKWVSPSTLYRLRAQIAEWQPEDIVREVSGRSRESRYATAGPGAGYDLVLTGRRVSGALKVRQGSFTSLVSGYVRPGRTVEGYARGNHMEPHYGGRHVLYEWTLPIPFSAAQMPVAVIAADLARSQRASEREGALRALARIKAEWAQKLGR